MGLQQCIDKIYQTKEDTIAEKDKAAQYAKNSANSAVSSSNSANLAGQYATAAVNSGLDITVPNALGGALGRLTSPLLDLPLKNSLSMKAGVGAVAFSRSTTATYIDRYGVLKTAAVGEPRFGKDGLLIEGSSTNILTYSQSFDGNDYYGDGGTLEQGKDNIDGSATAVKFIASTDNSAHFLKRLTFQLEKNKEYTLSVTIEKSGNYDYVNISHGNFASWETRGWATFNLATMEVDSLNTDVGTGNITAKITDLGNGRARCELRGGVRADNDDTSNFYIQTRESPNISGFIGDGSSGFIVHNIQIEKLPFASSYIETTDSPVTRGQDECDVTYNNNVINAINEYTFSMTVTLAGVGMSTLYNRGITGIVGEEYRYLRVNANGTSFGSSRFGSISPLDIESDIPFNYINTNNKTHAKSYLNGIAKNTSSSSVIDVGAKKLRIGRIGHEDKTYLFGHIKDYKFYDFELTPTEIALLGGKI